MTRLAFKLATAFALVTMLTAELLQACPTQTIVTSNAAAFATSPGVAVVTPTQRRFGRSVTHTRTRTRGGAAVIVSPTVVAPSAAFLAPTAAFAAPTAALNMQAATVAVAPVPAELVTEQAQAFTAPAQVQAFSAPAQVQTFTTAPVQAYTAFAPVSTLNYQSYALTTAPTLALGTAAVVPAGGRSVTRTRTRTRLLP